MFHVEHRIHSRDLSPEEGAACLRLYEKHEEALEDYVSKLLWWNDKVNLVSRNVSRETLQQHVRHSLVVSASTFFQKASRIIDTGTGGGLPGIPLAIAYPGKSYMLNDIVSKKIMAVKQMILHLGLSSRVDTAAVSIDELAMRAGDVVVSKHAFKVNDLWERIAHKPWQSLLLLKGKDDLNQELEGINTALSITIVDLEPGFKDPFYSGKALMEITRKENE